MHTQSIAAWSHDHVFLGAQHAESERRIWLVVGISLAMMIGEIVGGVLYGSMALVADGWHMSTHAGALGIAALAYRYARTRARDERFCFGTGKVGELAGFSSALILMLIALLIGYESCVRLLNPVSIKFEEATTIAAIGLCVNLVSAWLLRDRHAHEAGHEHADDDGGHHDHNLRAAYLHVVADAMTSVLAIAALLAGRFQGWTWLDPIMGIVGALVIVNWSYGLLRSSGAVLLDRAASPRLAAKIRKELEIGSDRVVDLHVWALGPGHSGVIASIVSHQPEAPERYKERLRTIEGLSHITIEVHACSHRPGN